MDAPALETKGFPHVFWLYLAAVALIAAGYADFPLILPVVLLIVPIPLTFKVPTAGSGTRAKRV